VTTESRCLITTLPVKFPDDTDQPSGIEDSAG
jgi:hypothetical protein